MRYHRNFTEYQKDARNHTWDDELCWYEVPHFAASNQTLYMLQEDLMKHFQKMTPDVKKAVFDRALYTIFSGEEMKFIEACRKISGSSFYYEGQRFPLDEHLATVNLTLLIYGVMLKVEMRKLQVCRNISPFSDTL